jgi:hypothetical protein
LELDSETPKTPKIRPVDLTKDEKQISKHAPNQIFPQPAKEQGGDLVPVSGASQEEIDTWNARCVGQRGGSYHQWVEFMNDRKTRFEFETWEARVKELQGPLMVAGWNTFDTE